MEWFKQFCGIRMSSNYQTFDLISRVLDDNPVEGIVEIGTYTGSLSIYLGLEGVSGKVPVHTYDIKRQFTEPTQRVFNFMNIQFHNIDVFESRHELFKQFNYPVFLLCDGGNKRDEFLMCVPQLKKGSIVAVHDYGTEFKDEHFIPFVDQNLCTPIMQDEWTKEDVRLALFRIN